MVLTKVPKLFLEILYLVLKRVVLTLRIETIFFAFSVKSNDVHVPKDDEGT